MGYLGLHSRIAEFFNNMRGHRGKPNLRTGETVHLKGETLLKKVTKEITYIGGMRSEDGLLVQGFSAITALCENSDYCIRIHADGHVRGKVL